jgi:hypothetical protein
VERGAVVARLIQSAEVMANESQSKVESPFEEAEVNNDEESPHCGSRMLKAEADNGQRGKVLLTLAVHTEDKTLRVAGVDNCRRPWGDSTGKGTVTNLYKQGISEARKRGFQFTSDFSVTLAAVRVWERLQAAGYRIEKNPEAAFEARLVSAYDARYGSPVGSRWESRDKSPVFRVVSEPAGDSAAMARNAAPIADNEAL